MNRLSHAPLLGHRRRGIIGKQIRWSDPICPICLKVVTPGEHVVFGHGELFHLDCRLGIKEVAAAGRAFLRQNPAKPYCHLCLMRALDVAYDDVRKAIARLRIAAAFEVGVAICSGCDRQRVTIKTRPPGALGTGGSATRVSAHRTEDPARLHLGLDSA